jgi:hypothetical protein
MTEDIHGEFDPNQKWHGEGYGCVWKHACHKWNPVTKQLETKSELKECDYRKNGFDVSGSERSGLYNKEHRNKAQRLNYFSKKTIGRIIDSRWKKSSSSTQGKHQEKTWKNKWKDRLMGPIGLLAQDREAWHINHKFKGKLIPWWGKDRRLRSAKAENFKPFTSGGWHYFFPYKHNYHHLIARGAFSNIVLNGKIPSGSKITPYQRLQIVLCKKYLHWNINNRDNIILLPNEEIHARIVGLPAHCPWEIPHHHDYTDMIESKLIEVRKAIDKAIRTKDHKKEINAAKKILEETQEELLDEVKKLKKL